MTASARSRAPPRERFDRGALHRLIAVTVLGFASGLPLALTGQAMQAWLSADGIDIATIGFLSLVGLPYTFKFLWAPLMDRFEPPVARPAPRLAGADPARARRGAVLDGGDAAGGCARARSRCSPCLVAFALGLAGRRRRRLPHRPAAAGRARHRLVAERARLPAGDDPLRRHRLHLGRPAQGGGWTWPEVYRVDGAVHGRRRGVLGAAAAAPGRCGRGRRASRATTWSASSPSSPRSAVGFVVTTARVLAAGARVLLAPLVAAAALGRVAARALGRPAAPCSPASPSRCRWPPGRRARARFETLLGGLTSYFAQPGAGAVPRLHRPLQARRRVRRLAADAVPAAGDGSTARPRSASSTR